MSHHTTDLGLRIEVRTESPDPGVPGSGALLAAAWQTVTSPPGEPRVYWMVQHRDGRALTTDTKGGAELALAAMAEEQPHQSAGPVHRCHECADETTRGQHETVTCGCSCHQPGDRLAAAVHTILVRRDYGPGTDAELLDALDAAYDRYRAATVGPYPLAESAGEDTLPEPLASDTYRPGNADQHELDLDPGLPGDRFGPHGAWPATTSRVDWRHGATDVCTGCRGPVEYQVRSDAGPMAGIGGWRHVAAGPDTGPGGTRTLCGRCGDPIEQGVDPAGGGWRHLNPPVVPHAGTPAPTYSDGSDQA